MIPDGEASQQGLRALRFADTHCHLDMPRFDSDRELVIQRAGAAGVSNILVPALNVPTSRTVVKLAAAHSSISSAVGIHPTEVEGLSGGAVDELRDLTGKTKVVAIGEIGLDYYWIKDSRVRRLQWALLEQQLRLAHDAAKPVVLHMREENDAEGGPCAEALMTILVAWIAGLRAENHPLVERPGVLHSFSGTLETALEAIALGFYIGVTGPVTYKKAAGRRDVIASLPLERLLIETDAPFLAPEPHRGERNEPAFVTHIADRIAEIQSRTLPDIANVTSANAGRLFAWGETV